MNQRREQAIGFLILFAVACAFGINSSMQDDTWRHLALGRHFLEHGLPATEPYGYAAEGRPFIDFSWLSCVLFYAVYARFSDAGLIMLTAFTHALTMAVALPKGARLRQNLLVSVALVVLISLAIRWRITARPEIFGLLFFTIGFRLVTAPIPTKTMAALVFLNTVIWNNFHATATLAPASILLILLGHSALKRREEALKLLLPLACSVAALFVNPWGAKLVYTSAVQALSPLNQTIFEFRPLPFNDWLPLRLPLLYGLAMAWAMNAYSRKENRAYAFFLVAATLLAVRYARCLPYPFLAFLYFGGGPMAAAFTGSNAHKALSGAVLPFAIAGIALLPLSYTFDDGLGLRIPKKPYQRAIDVLEAAGAQGKVVNDFTYGGYIMWAFNQRMKVFIDNRSPLYLDSTFPLYYQLLRYPDCLAVVPKLDDDAVVLPMPYYCSPRYFERTTTCGAVPACFDRGDWALVYFNEEAFVLLRRNAKHAVYIKAHEIKSVEPFAPQPSERLTYLKKSIASPKKAEAVRAELERLLKEDPGNDRALELTRGLRMLQEGP